MDQTPDAATFVPPTPAQEYDLLVELELVAWEQEHPDGAEGACETPARGDL